MKKIVFFFLLFFLSISLYSQEEVKIKNGRTIIVNPDGTWKYKQENTTSSTFTDPRDGHVYKTVTIGTQTWMTENLAYKTSNTLDEHGNSLAWCTGYSNNISEAAKYGYLYSFEAAKIACPSGWHLPTDAEWKILIDFLGGESVAGGKMKETGSTHWISPNVGATNESGFKALPGGYHNDGTGGFENILVCGAWWSSTTNDMGTWIRYLSAADSKAVRIINTDFYVPDASYSVRCVKDN